MQELAPRLSRVGGTGRWDPEAISPIAVHAEILRLYAAPAEGVAGAIQFRTEDGEPIGKRVSIIEVENIRISPGDGQTPGPELVEALACGRDTPQEQAGPGGKPVCGKP